MPSPLPRARQPADIPETVTIIAGSDGTARPPVGRSAEFEVQHAPTPLADPSAIAAPTRRSLGFGKYELIAEVGRGGMGVVYRARQIDLDRIVAIKMILSSHLASADQVDRFYAEARAAARLRHPNIVGMYEVGEHRGQHFFAMEFVDGPSLAQKLKAGPLDPTAAARCVLIVARAIQYLHTQGLVHRDLKPSNILLDGDDRPCVTDFGLAKMLEADGQVTHTGAIVGTPNYMSPEQAAGRAAAVGPLSDVYSLGAVLYESLTGRPPFSGEAPLETLVQVLEGEPARPRVLRPAIPAGLETICLKCLEKAPDRRYASAEALADDLERFLKGEAVEARRANPWQRLFRWSRREPALAARLSTLAICGSILQANHHLISNFARLQYQRSIALFLAWALASIAFQVALRRERWADLARYAWSAADLVLFTLFVWVNDGLNTSQVSGYFLLVAASGLWFREQLVWLTTVMAVASYGTLLLLQGFDPAGIESPYRHVVFATALAMSGVVVAYQVRRVRALSFYYNHRPLP